MLNMKIDICLIFLSVCFVVCNGYENVLNETLFWGSYTSQLYIGMRARHPASPRFGVIWGRPTPSIPRYKALDNVGVDSYTWHAHDGHHYGAQDIVDAENGITLKASWIKTGTREWSYRISTEVFGGKPTDEGNPLSITLFWSDPEGKKPLRAVGASRGKGATGRVIIKGESGVPEIGAYSVVFGSSPRGVDAIQYPPDYSAILPDSTKGHCLGVRAKKSDDDMGDTFLSSIQLNLINQAMNAKSIGENKGIDAPSAPEFLVPVLPDESSKNPNSFFVQRILTVPFTLDIAFIQNDLHKSATSADSTKKSKEGDLPTATIDKIFKKMTGSDLTKRLDHAEKAFENRVYAMFPTLTGLKSMEVVNERFTLDQIERFWAKNALANLLGSISYFSGDKYADEEMAFMDEVQRKTLFTTIESKGLYQYGSLFEAGLAQMLVEKWDFQLAKEILTSWFANQDPDSGYIPGHQVYGSFASKSAKKANIQSSEGEFGTAPTFLFPLSSYLVALKTENSINETNEWLSEMYPKLVAYYDWLRENQRGPVPYTFAWTKDSRGNHLGSGMPQYPRDSKKGSKNDKEMHLDGLCWMLFYSQLLESIGKHLEVEGTERFGEDHVKYFEAMNKYHLDINSKLYYDVAEYDPATDTVVLAQHFGLVSLFPLIMMHIRGDAVPLAATLRKMKNTLVTPYGLASLAKSDPLYSSSSQWRGGASIAMTFLVLNALKYYGANKGAQNEIARELFDTIRANTITCINNEFNQLAYIYEWYDTKTGKGYGAHPSTGSSSLALFILAEEPFSPAAAAKKGN